MGDTGRHIAALIKKRLASHAIFFFGLWPLATILFAVTGLKHSLALVAVNSIEHKLLEVLVITTGILAVEWVVSSVLLTAICAGFFALLEHVITVFRADFPSNRRAVNLLIPLEPYLFFLSASLGFAMEFPALLTHPLFAPLEAFEYVSAIASLAAVIAISSFFIGHIRSPFHGLSYALAAVAVSISAWVFVAAPVVHTADKTRHNSRVVIGIDSLSQADDLSILKSFTDGVEGTWFERAVTPGLVTNAVWPAILMNLPVHETNSFFVLQKPDWNANYNMVAAARKAGFETISRFSDQLTTFVGSDAGFDIDHSGPRGWRQLVTAEIKNASIFLPVILSHLPYLPGAATPCNQSGTYIFDLRQEVHTILTEGSGRRPTFVAAHLDYLHQPRFPGFSDLSPAEALRVRHLEVRTIRDSSLDWQEAVTYKESQWLRQWKISHLQKVLIEEINASGILEPEKSTRLVIFSDHGIRSGLTSDNFGDERYHHVLLVAFGIPGYLNPANAISLLDIDGLIGLPNPDQQNPADPVVEYTNIVAGDEWDKLIKEALPKFDGSILVNDDILKEIRQRLRAYRPYSEPLGYFIPHS